MDQSVQLFQIVSQQYRPQLLNLSCLGRTGSVEVQQLTTPAVAGATEGDYAVFFNKAGQSIAVWIDIDAANVPPTGAAFVASTFKVKAVTVTGNTATQVKTAVLAALGATLPTVTFASSGAATISATSTVDGDVAAPQRHNADDSGNGSFVVATLTPGVDSDVSVPYGFNQASIKEGAGLGDYTLTFKQPWVQIPQIHIESHTPQRLPQIIAVDLFTLHIQINDVTGAPADADFDVMCIGSMAESLIAN